MSAVGSILTNSGALTALNSIAQTSANTNNLQNELASGLSINSPSDNPAGYITAQGFTSQINGLTQATSNANQGVSLLQTAQSAIGQQIGVVQQLNSIAVQAANSTQTPAESQSLQDLVSQLTGQVTTIANQTQFNNINLLDGSFSGAQFQVGANEAQTINLSIGSTSADQLGMYSAGASSATVIGSLTTPNATITVGNATLSGVSYQSSAAAIAKAVNAQSANTGVSALASSSNSETYKIGTLSTVSFALHSSASAALGTLATGVTIAASASQSLSGIVSAINADTKETGISATESGSALTLTQSAGKNITFSNAGTAAAIVGLTTDPSSGTGTTLSGTIAIQRGMVQLQSSGGFSSTGLNGSAATVGLSGTLTSLNQIDVTSAHKAGNAISVIKFALQKLNNQDGQLGADQQRMSATINNLNSTSTNATTALGVVQDANIPAVANQLTQAQIQAQSGVAALKSSTQLAQTYLSLLP